MSHDQFDERAALSIARKSHVAVSPLMIASLIEKEIGSTTTICPVEVSHTKSEGRISSGL